MRWCAQFMVDAEGQYRWFECAQIVDMTLLEIVAQDDQIKEAVFGCLNYGVAVGAA